MLLQCPASKSVVCPCERIYPCRTKRSEALFLFLQATVYIYELIDEEVKVEKVEYSKDD